MLFPAGHTYRTSDQLNARNLTDVVISGYGATVALVGGKENPADPLKDPYALLLLQNCVRVKLVGLTLHDTTRTYRQNGVRIMKSTGLVVDSVRVQSVRFNGIGVFDAVPRTSDDILITNCTTEDTRFGISTNGRDVRIVNNHVAMDWTSTEEAVLYKHVHPGHKSDSDYFDGICVWAGADRTVIAGNTLTEIGQSAIWTEAVTHIVIANNTIISPQLHGIEIDGTADVDKSPHRRAVNISITGNVVANSVNGAINLLATTDATISGNTILQTNTTANSTGIAINSNSHKVTVTGNHIRQANPGKAGIFVKDNTLEEPNARATDVTVAWNNVEAKLPYLAPAETVIVHRISSTENGEANKRGEVTTQGTLKATGKMIANGGLGVGNHVAATSVGSVVRKMEVFSETGQSLGWIPIYNG